MNPSPIRTLLGYSCLLWGLVLSGFESKGATGLGSARLAFSPIGPGEYQFDTGIVRGKLGSRDKAIGLTSAVYSPSNSALDRSMGLCSLYRVFTRNHRYGTGAWDWPSQSQSLENGAVEVRWPDTAERPFVLSVTYRWMDPVTLEVITSVTAKQDLPDFEVFLASYFQPAFSNLLFCAKQTGTTNVPPKFIEASAERGPWQMVARDNSCLPLIQDGRWKLEPNPVEWKVEPSLGYPVALRRAKSEKITAMLMAPREDCFAVSMPQQNEGHYSIYLSLFGQTVPAGQTKQAKAYLMILQGIFDQQLVDVYRRRFLPH